MRPVRGPIPVLETKLLRLKGLVRRELARGHADVLSQPLLSNHLTSFSLKRKRSMNLISGGGASSWSADSRL
ncbi:Phytanoyl-CoA dioxygenase [Colletotrichum asianum]